MLGALGNACEVEEEEEEAGSGGDARDCAVESVVRPRLDIVFADVAEGGTGAIER